MQLEEEKIKEMSFPEKPCPVVEKSHYGAWQIFLWEGILFFLTLILGIITSWKILQIPEIEIQKIPLKPASFWEIIFSFAILLIVVLLIIRYVKFRPGKEIIFKIFFILPVFFRRDPFLGFVDRRYFCLNFYFNFNFLLG